MASATTQGYLHRPETLGMSIVLRWVQATNKEILEEKQYVLDQVKAQSEAYNTLFNEHKLRKYSPRRLLEVLEGNQGYQYLRLQHKLNKVPDCWQYVEYAQHQRSILLGCRQRYKALNKNTYWFNGKANSKSVTRRLGL